MNKSLEELHAEYLAANDRRRAAQKVCIAARRAREDASEAASVAWAAYKKRVDSAYHAAFKTGAQDE